MHGCIAQDAVAVVLQTSRTTVPQRRSAAMLRSFTTDQDTSDDRTGVSLLRQCRHTRKQPKARDFPHAVRLNSSRRRGGVAATSFNVTHVCQACALRRAVPLQLPSLHSSTPVVEPTGRCSLCRDRSPICPLCRRGSRARLRTKVGRSLCQHKDFRCRPAALLFLPNDLPCRALRSLQR